MRKAIFLLLAVVPARARQLPLSPRLEQTRAALVEGLSTREIGTRLGIARCTARRNVGEVLRRLEVVDRAELVAAAAPAASFDGSAGGGRELPVLARSLPTSREEQVLSLLRLGASDKRIGVALGVKSRTAKVHVGRVLRKLGVDRMSVIRPLAVPFEPFFPLTPREREAMKLALTGARYKAVAEAMGTTEQVVRNYMGVVFEKFGVHSCEELKRVAGNLPL